MKAFLNWSGGKDSSLCLHYAKQLGIDVSTLLTSLNAATDRISMHGVRRTLLQRQAACLGLPLQTLELPEAPGMDTYENTLQAAHQSLRSTGYTHALYGDIFLEDLRQYRESLLQKDGLEALFPLWGKDSKTLLKTFIDLGFKAVVVCVNSRFLDESFCGRLLDAAFLVDLPPGVDPCGENGEYHSFVFDGPFFQQPVAFVKGETVYREYAAPKAPDDDCFTAPAPPAGFYFCDLLP